MPEPLYTTDQVAEMLHVSGDTVRRWLRNGTLQGKKLPRGTYLISQSDINDLLKPA